MPLFLGSDDTFLPTTVDPKSGHQSKVPVPFRTDLPATFLVSYDDIRCVCPVVTHMITRCVKNDLKKNSQKLVDDKHPKEKESLARLEENLTKQDLKKRYDYQIWTEGDDCRCGVTFWVWSTYSNCQQRRAF